ncbi:hypothetical protein FUT87_12735, partial [Mitsuaria sp. TWR114]
MAALGLICVLASGSCWAQQSTSSTTDKPKAQAKAAPDKPAAKKKPEAKSAKTAAKASKDTKAAKPVASKNGAKDPKAKAEDDKASTASEAVTDKAIAARPEAKVAEKTADKAAEKTSEKTAPARSEAKTPDAKADARAEAGVDGQALDEVRSGCGRVTHGLAPPGRRRRCRRCRCRYSRDRYCCCRFRFRFRCRARGCFFIGRQRQALDHAAGRLVRERLRRCRVRRRDPGHARFQPGGMRLLEALHRRRVQPQAAQRQVSGAADAQGLLREVPERRLRAALRPAGQHHRHAQPVEVFRQTQPRMRGAARLRGPQQQVLDHVQAFAFLVQVAQVQAQAGRAASRGVGIRKLAQQPPAAVFVGTQREPTRTMLAAAAAA